MSRSPETSDGKRAVEVSYGVGDVPTSPLWQPVEELVDLRGGVGGGQGAS